MFLSWDFGLNLPVAANLPRKDGSNGHAARTNAWRVGTCRVGGRRSGDGSIPPGDPHDKGHLEAAVAAGKISFEDMTLADLLERWMEHIAGLGRADTTLYHYRQYIDRELRPVLGAIRLSKLKAPDIDRLYTKLRKRGLAPATIRQVHAILRASLNQAERWGLVQRNVAKLASAPSQQQREQHPPDVADVLALLTAAKDVDPMFGLYIRVMVATGSWGAMWQVLFEPVTREWLHVVVRVVIVEGFLDVLNRVKPRGREERFEIGEVPSSSTGAELHRQQHHRLRDEDAHLANLECQSPIVWTYTDTLWDEHHGLLVEPIVGPAATDGDLFHHLDNLLADRRAGVDPDIDVAGCLAISVVLQCDCSAADDMNRELQPGSVQLAGKLA